MYVCRHVGRQACMCVCLCVCLSVCMYVCMYVRMYIDAQKYESMYIRIDTYRYQDVCQHTRSRREHTYSGEPLFLEGA